MRPRSLRAAGVATTHGVPDHTVVLGGAFVTVYRIDGVATRIAYRDTRR